MELAFIHILQLARVAIPQCWGKISSSILEPLETFLPRDFLSRQLKMNLKIHMHICIYKLTTILYKELQICKKHNLSLKLISHSVISLLNSSFSNIMSRPKKSLFLPFLTILKKRFKISFLPHFHT